MRVTKGGARVRLGWALGLAGALHLLGCNDDDAFWAKFRSCEGFVDLQTHHDNCGKCGRACERDDMCLDGECAADRSFALWPVPPLPQPTSQYERIAEGVILDTVTNLEWQEPASEEKVLRKEAVDYCIALKVDGGGFRLPTRMELLSIVDFTRRFPATNAEVFPSTQDSGYQHTILYPARYARATSLGGQQIDFADGSDQYFPTDQPVNPGLDSYVRCVRGGTEPAPFDGHYEVTDETVLDTYTGLRWQRYLPPCDASLTCPAENVTRSYEVAVQICDDMELDGFDDYRLPSVLELYTLIYPLNILSNAHLDRELFPQANEHASNFYSTTLYDWTTSEDQDLSEVDIRWVMREGKASFMHAGLRVRCVRDER